MNGDYFLTEELPKEEEYELQVCDDEGNVAYSQRASYRSQKQADDAAYRWAVQVEAEEGFMTTYAAVKCR